MQLKLLEYFVYRDHVMFRRSGYYFTFLFFLAGVGFWESYFSKFFVGIDSVPHFTEINSYIHFHAASMLLWISMLITQASLIRFNKRTLHRLIGKFSYPLFPVLVISIILLAHSQISIHDYGISYGRLYVLFLQLLLMVIFIIAYVFAIINRHSPASHARYMISGALTMVDPAVARIPIEIPPLPFSYQVLTFSLIDLILIVLIVMERNQKQGRTVFPIMLCVIVTFQAFNLLWTRSEVWDDFALWFAKLPLT